MSVAGSPPTITKACPQCGVMFTYPRTRGHGLRTYCSAACRNAAAIEQMRQQRTEHRAGPFKCRNCGTVVDEARSIGRPKLVYCSKVCDEEHRAARRRAENEARRAGRTCLSCGGPIPLGLSLRALTCSVSCGNDYQNRIRSERARVARSLRPRPPCTICGAAIDPARRRNVIYCSEACKRIALAKRYRARYPDDQARIRYQMQPGEYEALLQAQGGRCAICGADEPGGKGGRFHVDHDHTTGEIRGLLCHACNVGIGLLHEDADLMRAAIRYIEREV